MSIETVSTYMENVIDSNVNRSRNLQAVFALPAAHRAAPRCTALSTDDFQSLPSIGHHRCAFFKQRRWEVELGGSLLSFNKGSFHRSTAI